MTTLLILGAGASKAVNDCFPTGFELLQSINSHLFNDKNDIIPGPGEGEYVSDLTNKVVSIIKRTTNQYERELKLYKKKLYRYISAHESKYLRNVLPKSISIDDFTAQNDSPFFQAISKYATAHILKGAEHAFFESTKKKTVDWISLFLQEFSKDKSNLENLSSRLKIVSFNYDRLFPFLFNEFVGHNFPDLPTARQEFDDSCIDYIYGSLGNIKDIPFDSPNDDMSRMISAYTRFHLLEKKFQAWPPDMKFETIGFVGFGFDETNFQNLNLGQFSSAKVYTSFYFPGEKDNQSRQLEKVFDKSNITYVESVEKLARSIFSN